MIFVRCKTAQNAIIFLRHVFSLARRHYPLLMFVLRSCRYFIDGFLHYGCSMMIYEGIIGEKGRGRS